MKKLTEMQLNTILDWMEDNEANSHWVDGAIEGVRLIQEIMVHFDDNVELSDIEDYLKEQ